MELKVVIVEDEKHSSAYLRHLLEEYCVNIKVLGIAASVAEAICIISHSIPDVVFMDVELQNGTGFDVLSQILDPDFEVIFTTAYDHYALQAVKYSLLDYLLKPVDIEELQNAVTKARKRKNQKIYRKQLETLLSNIKTQNSTHAKMCLATAEGFEFIQIDEIVFCKASGSYTLFVLKNNTELLVSKHLKEYEELLPNSFFMRVHHSFLINLREVKKFVKSEGGYIVMSNQVSVSISRSKKEAFLKAMSRFNIF